MDWARSTSKKEIDLKIVRLLSGKSKKTPIKNEEIQKSNDFEATSTEGSRNSKKNENSSGESKHDLPTLMHDATKNIQTETQNFENIKINHGIKQNNKIKYDDESQNFEDPVEMVKPLVKTLLNTTSFTILQKVRHYFPSVCAAK